MTFDKNEYSTFMGISSIFGFFITVLISKLWAQRTIKKEFGKLLLNTITQSWLFYIFGFFLFILIFYFIAITYLLVKI